MSSQVPRITSPQDELRDGRRIEGTGDIPPSPSKASTSQRPGFGIDIAVFALERLEHSFINVHFELEKVPTIVERLSRIDGILLDGHRFNAEEAMDYVKMERILISVKHDGAAHLIQSSARMLNTIKCFKTIQDSRCMSYEEDDDLVIKQMEQNEAPAGRTAGDTKANVSDNHRNDADLEAPVLEVS